MSADYRTYQCWEGGCFERIYAALSNMIDEAESNLIIGSIRPGDDHQYISWDRKAKRFRDSAFDLIGELFVPSISSARFPRPAEYPLKNTIAEPVQQALNGVVVAVEELMRRWEWIVDDPSQLGKRLVYRMDEDDLERLRECLFLLDKVWHHLFYESESAFCYPERRPPPPPLPRSNEDKETEPTVAIDESGLSEAEAPLIVELSELAPERRLATKSKSARLNPKDKAIAAMMDLQQKRQPISLRAVCTKAKIDRGHLVAKYPEVIKMIENLAGPDRVLKRGIFDQRNSNLDAFE